MSWFDQAAAVVPACDAVNVCVPIVTLAVRGDPEFAAALTVTTPLPVPDAPFVTVSQFALLVAVHAHVVPVVTAIDPESPAAAMDCDAGEMANVQGAAACVAVKTWPAIVTVADRVPPPFAAAVTTMVLLPVPDPALLTVSQLGSLLVADHTQPLPVVSAIDPLPPPTANA